MSHEPGLRFWLEYVAREGALVDNAGDHALVILPEYLQQAFGLAEDVRVTSDPEVAADEGAILLIPGHPVLDEAAGRAVAGGDAGHRFLPWPRSTPPDPAGLLERARAHFAVDHGRIDAAGEPAPAYVPALRAGAVVVYTVDHRFQEREEVWVDGRGGLLLPEPARRQVAAAPPLTAADTAHPVLAPDFTLALRGAHAAIEDRAAARAEALARLARGAREEERARAEAYYADVLASIKRRREAAAPDRQALFDAQVAATGIERDRRLEEIEEKFRVRHEIHPFRLHLVLVPSLFLPVHVRRGERLYPFALTWFLAGGCFAPVRCPHCGAPAPLVAGRERLGCAGCLPRRPALQAPPARPTPAPEPGETAAPARGAAPASDAAPDGRAGRPSSKPVPAVPVKGSPVRANGRGTDRGITSKVASSRPGGVPSGLAKRRTSPLDGTEGLIETLLERYERQRGQVLKMGEKLAVAFWQRAVGGRRWPKRGGKANSPLETLYRLYGPTGPLLALGLKPGALPEKVRAHTEPRLDVPLGGITTGYLLVGKDSCPFTLRWYAEGGEAVVTEVLPYPDAFGTDLPAPQRMSREVAPRLFVQAPPPRIALDSVSAALWEKEIAAQGLPFVVRCLTTWWSVAASAGTSFPPLALAAGVASLVGQESGVRRSQVTLGAAYEVRPAKVGEARRRLYELLGAKAQQPR